MTTYDSNMSKEIKLLHNYKVMSHNQMLLNRVNVKVWIKEKPDKTSVSAIILKLPLQ